MFSHSGLFTHLVINGPLNFLFEILDFVKKNKVKLQSEKTALKFIQIIKQQPQRNTNLC